MSDTPKALGKRVLRSQLVILCVAAVVLIVFFATRPHISGSILEMVTLENGAYVLDDLHRGMTEEEVTASLDARNLVYTSAREAMTWGDLLTDTWITLSGESRITELGSVNVRRTYYFERGELTHVDMETVGIQKNIADDFGRFEKMVQKLQETFGPAEQSFDISLDVPGEVYYTWEGADGSSMMLTGRYYQEENGVRASPDKPAPVVDYLDILIRITF